MAASSAKPLDLRADVSGIDAQLVEGASVSGTVTAPGAANYAGVCAYAIGPSGTVSDQAVTSASGAYHLANLVLQAYTIGFDPNCSQGLGSNSFYGPQGYPKSLQLSPGESLGGRGRDAPARLPPPLWPSRRPPWREGRFITATTRRCR